MKNLNPYLDYKKEDFENFNKYAEEILNNEIHLIGKPLYDFYQMISNNGNYSEPEKQKIWQEAEKSQKMWFEILDLWNQEKFNLAESFMIHFNYPLKKTLLESVIKTEPVKIPFEEEDIPNIPIEVLQKYLSPTAYIPTDIEIEFNRYRFAFEEYVWDRLHSMSCFYSIQKEKLEKDYVENPNSSNETFCYNIENHTKYYLEVFNLRNTFKGAVLEDLVSSKWFQTAYVNGLSDEHGGDCTAFAVSCMRCHAEEMFSIPHTARWSKSKGYSMIMRVTNHHKKIKQENNEN